MCAHTRMHVCALVIVCVLSLPPAPITPILFVLLHTSHSLDPVGGHACVRVCDLYDSVCVYDYVWVTVHVRTCAYFATPCHLILIYFAPVQEYGFIMWMGVYFSLFVCVRCIMLMGVWFSMFVCMRGCVLVLMCEHVGRTLDPKFFSQFSLFLCLLSPCVSVAIPRLCGYPSSLRIR